VDGRYNVKLLQRKESLEVQRFGRAKVSNVRLCGSNIPTQQTMNIAQPYYVYIAQLYKVKLISLCSLHLNLPVASFRE
jgi:hypothetical protein